MDRNDPIRFASATGKVENASLVERLGIFMFSLAGTFTNGFERPGFSKIAKLIRTFLPSDRDIQVLYGDGSKFLFPYGDAYWGVLCRKNAVYESEIAALVMLAKEPGTYFIDCGANFGYWSVRVSGEDFGVKRAIAIEASGDSAKILKRNSAVNADRFAAYHRAISDVTGQIVTLHGGEKHEQRSIDPNQGVGGALEKVETLKLDDIDGIADDGAPIIIKLDVEGVEIPALNGATKLLARETLIAYEEHGKDRTHEVSRALKEVYNMRLFAWSEKGGFTEIFDLDALDALKPNRRRGYDFFASASDKWANLLLSSSAG